MRRLGGGARAGRWAAILLLGVIVGCEAVAGIEDRTFVAQGSDADPACASYCDAVMNNCVDDQAVYSSRETCLGVCAQLPPGDPNERTDDNSLACRAYQAELAGQVDHSESATNCRRAGPGGDGYCGDECENYCYLFLHTCDASELTQAKCETGCATLRDEKGFDLVAQHEGDSVECRLVHVSSATVDPETHCEHAQLNSPEWCIDPEDDVPDCADYCRMTQAACTGDFAVYESEAECLAACDALPRGFDGDRSENTVGCRYWHAHNALIDPETHCPHAGPGGDGHCGSTADGAPGNCVSYCDLLATACSAGLADAYGDVAGCRADCAAEPPAFRAEDDSFYSVAAGDAPGTFDCRLLHVTRALLDPAECAAALGEGDCQ